MTTDNKVSVVIPVYNNSDSVTELTESLSAIFIELKYAYEIIFINDASKDNSLETLIQISKKHKEVLVVDLKYNIGQHAAVFHGLRFVKGDSCIIMDADLQDPPESIKTLIANRSIKHEVIFAGRVGNYQSNVRMLTSKVYKLIINKLTGLPKNAGIFMLIEKKLIDKLLQIRVRTIWINIMVGLSSSSLYVIPVERNFRDSGKSSYSSIKRIKSALNGIYCALSYYLMKPQKSYLETLKEDPVSAIYPRNRKEDKVDE